MGEFDLQTTFEELKGRTSAIQDALAENKVVTADRIASALYNELHAAYLEIGKRIGGDK